MMKMDINDDDGGCGESYVGDGGGDDGNKDSNDKQWRIQECEKGGGA